MKHDVLDHCFSSWTSLNLNPSITTIVTSSSSHHLSYICWKTKPLLVFINWCNFFFLLMCFSWILNLRIKLHDSPFNSCWHISVSVVDWPSDFNIYQLKLLSTSVSEKKRYVIRKLAKMKTSHYTKVLLLQIEHCHWLLYFILHQSYALAVRSKPWYSGLDCMCEVAACTIGERLIAPDYLSYTQNEHIIGGW